MSPTLTVRVSDSVGNETLATHDFDAGPPATGDQTAELQAIVDAAPNGSVGSPTVVDLAGATYRVDGRLMLLNRNWLTLKNFKVNGSMRTSGTAGDSHVYTRLGTHVTYENVEVEGAHVLAGAPTFKAWVGPNGEDWHGHHGFATAGSTFTHYENCYAHHVYGDGFYVAWHDPGPGANIPSEDITFNNCRVLKTGRQGVAIVFAKRVTWTGGSVKQARAWLFDLEPLHLDGPCEDVTIDGVDCTGPHRLGVAALAGAASGTYYGRIKILNVTTDSQAVSQWPVIYGTSPVGQPARGDLEVTGLDVVHNHRGRPWFEVTGWTNVVSTPNTVNGLPV